MLSFTDRLRELWIVILRKFGEEPEPLFPVKDDEGTNERHEN